jgi:molecular chaperone DnaK
MPAVRQKVREIFAKEGDTSLNPDEVVAIGASVQGAILKGEVSDIVLLDVTPLSLGVETAGKVFTKIIDRNTTIPTKKSKIFTTAEDNQSFVNVHVLQGEREIIDFNKTLAKFELTEIPPAPRAVPQIEVTFAIDSNGIVSVKAKDLGTGKEQAIKVRTSSGLSEREIKDIIEDAQAHATQDAEAKNLATSRIELESLIFSSEKSVNEFQNALTSETVEKVSKALAQSKKLLEAGPTLEQIQNAKTELTDAAHEMAEEIYGQVAQSND